MQIHEITKGPTRTDEGVLDDLKAAVTAAKTGYKAGGLKGAAKNLTSRTAYNQALQQNQRASTMKDLDKLEKKWGTKIKRPLTYYVDQLKTPTSPEFKDEASQAEKQRNSLTPEFADTFINDEPTADQGQAADQPAQAGVQPVQPTQATQPVQPNQATPPAGEPGQALPDPGQALTVQKNKGNYYKTPNGKWYTETGDQLPQSSYAGLEDLITQDQYKQVPIPPSVPGGQVQPEVKGKAGKKAVKESDTLSERASAARTARRAAARKGTPPPAGAPANPAAATPAGAPSQKKPRANLKADFGQWIASQMGSDYQSVISNSVVKSELTKIFTAMTQNKDPKMAQEMFKRYVLIVQAAILKSKVEQGIDNDEGQSPNDDAVAQLKGKEGKKTGNPEADHILQNLGMKLNESQVAVSKDIHVKSSLGDYIKRASDQQWYDPKGVLISQEKYPDFVKKLDATPAAQTAYQAALSGRGGSGSDSAYIKAQVDAQVKAQLDAQAKKAVAKAEEMHPPEPPPQATAADWELYKAQANRINNQMIDKTINDLRNAEYFNTGQQDYLKQQMAQLMAKKF